MRTTERKFGEKGKWNGIFLKFRSTPRGCTFSKFRKMLFHSILEICENLNRNFCSIGKPEQPRRCSNEDSVQCRTTYLDSGIRIFFTSLWQREAFKYWFEAATKGHPGSCLAVGEGVSSGLYVDRNCPLGVV